MAVDRILVVDDELIIRKSIEEVLRAKRYSVSTAGDLKTAEKLLARDSFDLIFLDVRLPDGLGTDLLERLGQLRNQPVIVMITGYGTIESAVSCMRLGAMDYLIKPFSLSQIEVLVRKAEATRQILQVNRYLTERVSDSSNLAGNSPAMVELKRMIKRVAATDATVLICGENGTGKELVSHEIFRNSARASGPYIKINCAAVSESLIESEFFGHEKGAFTGAIDRREGRFELAHGGTLLLDEISEIAPHLQAKLLRVLQEREFERVGGSKTIKVDVRVLATTNRDLKEAVANGEFREDLYYRLAVFPIQVPALRERAEDIPDLVESFLARISQRNPNSISRVAPEAMRQLIKHDWPGNVRELQNLMERAIIMCEDDDEVIGTEALGFTPVNTSNGSEGKTAVVSEPKQAESSTTTEKIDGQFLPLDELERRHILQALDHTGGNRTLAAEKLGISIRTLRNKLNLYRIQDSVEV